MIFRYTILSLTLLMPGALSAGQGASRAQRMDILKHATTAANIVVSMKFYENPGRRRTANRSVLCIPQPNGNGEYILESIDAFTQNITFAPLLTDIRIDPANPAAPSIKFRFEKCENVRNKDEPFSPKSDDIELCVPYAIAHTIPLDIEKKGSFQEFNLEICIERNPLEIHKGIISLYEENIAVEQNDEIE